uniref:Reverse transcriptase domain-containing protein n=1 Tax=Sphaeramia orbicularis TaxID=375764 RepID=A0A672ZDJ1_9TELE
MIIFPKIQYILYMLPLNFPPSLLKLYNTVVESYIWSGKRPTFSRSKLYAAKKNGGLSLFKIEWYQYAFSLSQLTKINNLQEQLPSWVKIEEVVVPTSLEAFLTQRGRPVPFKDLVLTFVQETWMGAHQLIKSSPYLTPKSSIWYNKKILIGKKPVIWEKWAKAGINLLCDLLSENGLMSFDEIKQKFNLRQEEKWDLLYTCYILVKKMYNCGKGLLPS